MIRDARKESSPFAKSCFAKKFNRLENHPHRIRGESCQYRVVIERGKLAQRRKKVYAPKTKDIVCLECNTADTVPWKSKLGICRSCKRKREYGFRSSGRWARDSEKSKAWRKEYYVRNKERIAAFNKARSGKFNEQQKLRYWKIMADPSARARLMIDKSMSMGVRRCIKKCGR